MSSTVARIVDGKGASASYAQQLLARYLTALNENPLRTKAITAGVLNGLQELVAQWVTRRKTTASQQPATDQTGAAQKRPCACPFDERVLKMALYGN